MRVMPRALAALWLSSCTFYDATKLDRQSADPATSASQPSAVIGSELPIYTRCGDGIISGPEKCDMGIEWGLPGACPTECPPLAPCAPRAVNGTACQAECVLLTLGCTDGDGCCSGLCGAANDDDCSPSCGNGRIESDRGESCETAGAAPECKTSAAACNDGDACTVDKLIGSSRNCNSECLWIPVTTLGPDGCCPRGADANSDEDCEPVCGNRVLEAGEECDSATGCTADCRIDLQPEQVACLDEFGDDECGRCTCLQCAAEYLACQDGPDPLQNALCGAVVDCSEREHCVGTACYCGAFPFCRPPLGPCRSEIEAAAGTIDPWLITAQRADPSTTLGRASLASACRARQCSDVCLLRP